MIIYKETVKITTDFTSETMEIRRQWNKTLTCSKKESAKQ